MLNRLTNDRYQPWIVAALYVLVTVWMTWPLTPNAGSAVQDPGDPLFEIWVMRAVQHRLVNDPLDLYDANAFYPFDGSLAYSEEAISTALLAWPVYLVSGNDVLAYNVMLLSAFWLVAFAVYLLARELGSSHEVTALRPWSITLRATHASSPSPSVPVTTEIVSRRLEA